MRLSVVIITFNEGENIRLCLHSVKDIADEIVIVDSGSTDNTIEIARKYGAKIYRREFDNYANQKNFALSKATGDWIFSIDADEEVTPDLASEIQSVTSNQSSIISHSAYLIPRRNIIFGKEIKHTRWSPDKHIWLWKNGSGRWNGRIHEEVEVKGSVGELKNAKIHHSHKSVGKFISMLNKYTELEAEELIATKQKYSILKLFGAPIISFMGRYFYKKGFLDGWRGFVLSYLRAFYKFVIWAKVWEKTR